MRQPALAALGERRPLLCARMYTLPLRALLACPMPHAPCAVPHALWQAAARTQPRRTNTWHRSPPCSRGLIAGPVCGRRHLPAANWRSWRLIRAILARSPRLAPALAVCATRPIVALRPRSAMPLTAGTSRLRGRRRNRSVETSPLRWLCRARPARFVGHALVRGTCLPTLHHHSRRRQPRSPRPFNLRLTSESEQGRRPLCPARWVRITTWDEVSGVRILVASPGRGKRLLVICLIILQRI